MQDRSAIGWMAVIDLGSVLDSAVAGDVLLAGSNGDYAPIGSRL